MSKERDSKKRIAFPIQLFGEGSSFAELPDEIHVVPTGKWQHPVYGEMEITSAHIAEFVKNFKDKVRKDLPITAGHDNGMNGGELEAIGWFKELIDRGVKGLYAVVEWTPEGQRLLSERAFKYFSPEFYEEYSDPETGERRNHVLVGGALTNRPYFKELDAVVVFSEPQIIHQFSDDMDLKQILAKKASELNNEEKDFLRKHKEELNDEQKTAFKSVFDEDGGGGASGEEESDDEGGEEGDEGGGSAGGDQVVASEVNGKKVYSVPAALFETLQKSANDGAKAFAEVEKIKIGNEVEKLVFSASNADGRIKPAQKKAVIDLMLTLSEKQRDQFRNILNNLPKADKSIFTEIGDGGAPEQTKEAIAAQVKQLATEKVKASEGALAYADAVQQVYSEKPELKAAYDAALEAEAK